MSPVWKETIDLTPPVRNHEDPWDTVRDNVIPIIKASAWYRDSLQVQDLVDENLGGMWD